jgi:hypothetical protein
VQGKEASRTPPPAEAREKSPAAPGPTPAFGVGAPAPRAGDDAVSLADWTDLAPCDTGDAPPGEKAKRTDLCAVHLIRAIYRRHRKHKSKSKTMRPESKQKEK